MPEDIWYSRRRLQFWHRTCRRPTLFWTAGRDQAGYAKCQNWQLLAISFPSLQVCLVSSCVEAVSYCWSALLPFLSICSSGKMSVRSYRFQLRTVLLFIYQFCVGGPCVLVVPSLDFTVVTGEEKCASEPLCSSHFIIVVSLFLLDCCLKSKGYFKNDWINCSCLVWSSF